MKFQPSAIVLCGLLWAITMIEPRYPREQWLQHVPTALSLPALWIAARRGWLSNLSSGCLVFLLALHVIGARWVYSFVPYDQWCAAVVGSGPSDWFGWERNHYDRMVHFAFGLLSTVSVSEAARRYARTASGWAAVIAFGFVAAASATYEVFEWLLAMIAAPEFADRYNGQQGDMWDAQKDMALALLGSLISCACIGAATFNRQRQLVRFKAVR